MIALAFPMEDLLFNTHTNVLHFILVHVIFQQLFIVEIYKFQLNFAQAVYAIKYIHVYATNSKSLLPYYLIQTVILNINSDKNSYLNTGSSMPYTEASLLTTLSLSESLPILRAELEPYLMCISG